MTTSQTRFPVGSGLSVRRCIWLAVFVLVFAASNSVRAQTILPEPETEEDDSVQVEQPVGLTPQTLVPSSSEVTNGQGPGTKDESNNDAWLTPTFPADQDGVDPVQDPNAIEINHLMAVTGDSVGTLTMDTGGFPVSMWQGTRYQTVQSIMMLLPVKTTSSALRRMLQRLLLSQALPPENLIEEGAFIAQRLETLSALGEDDAAADLLAITPGRQASPRLVRIETDVALSDGRFVDACAQASSVVREGAGEYWQKLLVFCQILAGAGAEAELGIALLREVGVDDPDLFLMLDSMIRGETPVLNTLDDQSSLHMAVVRASSARFGPDAVDTPSPVVLAALSANKDLDMADRLTAGEQALASGALSVERFRELLMSPTFTQEEIAGPISSAEGMPGTMARALLYQVASAQSVHSVRAEAVSLALQTASRDGLYASTASAFMNIVSDVPARSDLIWFADDVVRAFILAGNENATTDWLQMLSHNAARQQEARDVLIALTPVVRVAGVENQGQIALISLAEWVQESVGHGINRGQKALLFSLLDSLGTPVAAQLWENLGHQQNHQVDDGVADSPNQSVPVADPAMWFRLSSAANGGRVGETVLLAALVLGEEGPAHASAVTMGHVVRNLSMLGLTEEARRLAIEAVITSGL